MAHREHREAGRQRLLADVQQSAEATSEAGFDIDEVAAEAAELPTLPEPPPTLDGIDAALNNEFVRPPAVDWRPLDRGSYAVQAPGMSAAVRATTAAEVFDDHCDSHLFLSPRGWFFNDLAQLATDGEADLSGDEQQDGHLWLVEPDNGPCELIAITRHGEQRIQDLAHLLEILPRLGKPSHLEPERFARAAVRFLA